tara:strand:+ start:10309 stop:10569 length:261 start_codon:yes stop_codon:yes gene_type:complete
MTKVLKVRNHLVPEFWAEGKPASNHTGCFTTDGERLFSYSLLIGDTCEKTGAKVLRDYTARGRHGFQSMTTSQHVGRARTAADIVD